MGTIPAYFQNPDLSYLLDPFFTSQGGGFSDIWGPGSPDYGSESPMDPYGNFPWFDPSGFGAYFPNIPIGSSVSTNTPPTLPSNTGNTGANTGNSGGGSPIGSIAGIGGAAAGLGGALGAGGNSVGGLAGFAGLGGDLLSQLIGGITGANNQDWLRGALATVLANLQNEGVGPGSQIFYNQSGQVDQNILNNLGSVGGSLGSFLQDNNVGQNIQNFTNQIPGLFNQTVGQQGFQSPAMGQAQQGLFDLNNNLGGPAGTANQVFQSGGWTPQYQQGYDAITQLLGQNIPGLQNAAGSANSIIGNQGNTSLLNLALGPLAGILNKGGATGQSNALSNQGLGILNSPFGESGLTPTGAIGEASALPALLSGGATPYTQGAQQFGMSVLNTPALMSPEEAASFAQNQAGTTFRNNAQQAFEQAMRRGGGPGAITSGLQNEAMTDYADKGSQAISQAVQQALLNQQQLQLQQQQQGAQTLLGGANAQNNLLGTYGGILGNMEGIASGRTGIGANMLANSGNMANSLLGTALSGVPNVQNAATSNLGAGTNLANLLQSGFLGGLSNLTGMMGNQNQYALGAGNLMNNLTGTQGNILNNIYQGGLGSGQLGGSLFNNLTNANLGSFGAQNQWGNLLNTMLTGQVQPLVNLAGMGSDIWKTGLGGQPGIFGNQGNTTTSPWSILASPAGKG